jgi:hypothetical protein
MRRSRVLFSLPAVIVLCTGCGLITGVDEYDRCDGPPDVTIETGDDVWFRWGKCSVDQLTVISEELLGVWVVEGEVRSPVQYGVAKKRMDVQFGPDPLQPGATYKLVLGVRTEEGLVRSSWWFTR